jgi:hypothetical protein
MTPIDAAWLAERLGGGATIVDIGGGETLIVAETYVLRCRTGGLPNPYGSTSTPPPPATPAGAVVSISLFVGHFHVTHADVRTVEQLAAIVDDAVWRTEANRAPAFGDPRIPLRDGFATVVAKYQLVEVFSDAHAFVTLIAWRAGDVVLVVTADGRDSGVDCAFYEAGSPALAELFGGTTRSAPSSVDLDLPFEPVGFDEPADPRGFAAPLSLAALVVAADPDRSVPRRGRTKAEIASIAATVDAVASDLLGGDPGRLHAARS